MTEIFYKICPNCNYFCRTVEDNKFCPECGTRLLEHCPQCGSSIDFPYIRFCGKCGARLRNNGEDLKQIFSSAKDE